MPIVSIEIVEIGEVGGGADAAALASALGAVFGSGPGETWVRLGDLPASRYAENDAVAPKPVFVRVLKAVAGTGEERRGEARRIAGAVAKVTGRPAENVHVLYEPDARGRIAFGGELRD